MSKDDWKYNNYYNKIDKRNLYYNNDYKLNKEVYYYGNNTTYRTYGSIGNVKSTMQTPVVQSEIEILKTLSYLNLNPIEEALIKNIIKKYNSVGAVFNPGEIYLIGFKIKQNVLRATQHQNNDDLKDKAASILGKMTKFGLEIMSEMVLTCQRINIPLSYQTIVEFANIIEAISLFSVSYVSGKTLSLLDLLLPSNQDIIKNSNSSLSTKSASQSEKERQEKERLEKERQEREERERKLKEENSKRIIEKFLNDITNKQANDSFRGWVLPNGLLMSQYNESSELPMSGRQDHGSLVRIFMQGLSEYDKDAYDKIVELYDSYNASSGVTGDKFESFAVERLGWMQVSVCGQKIIAYRAERWQDRILRPFLVDYGFTYVVADSGRSYEREFAHLYDHMDEIIRLGLNKRVSNQLSLKNS